MKSILVIGLGRLGLLLSKNMAELGNDVMVVDKDEEVIEEVSGLFTDAHIGDCTNEAVLRSLSVSGFDLCFVTIGSNFESSLVITTTGTDDSRLLPCTRCSSSSPVMVGMTRSSSMREMSL